MSDSIFNNEILPTGYDIFRKDRALRGGGVLLAVDQSIPSKELQSPHDLEVLSVEISSPIAFLVCVVYMPPNAALSYCQRLIEYLAQLCEEHRVIILGDFNLPDVNWLTMSGSSESSQTFCDFVFDFGLVQLVDEPTHMKGNILDLILTNVPSHISNVAVQNEATPISTDHFAIYFSLSGVDHGSANLKCKTTYDYTKTDMESLNSYLLDYDFSACETSDDVEVVWLFVKKTITDAVRMFTPTIRLRARPSPKWFTSHTRNKIHSLRKKAKANSSASNLDKLSAAEASLRAFMEESKSTYINDLVCNFNKYFPSVFTSSEFSLPPLGEIQLPEETMSDVRFSEEEVFAALQNLDPNKAMGIDGIHQRVLKYCSVSLYKPIHNLFSLCTSSNRLPSEWKVHRITPVFKSGDRVLISNYRPISLLCSVSKVLERLVYDKISSFTLAQVTNNQFGFMPNQSCLQQLLVFVDSVVRCQERKSQLDVVYVDIRKAFDSVPHGELLYKLRKFGIVGNLWYLFRDYLTSRVQCVAIENELSHLAPVASGVPQGSILGPLFFLLYINDMPLAMPMLRAFMFADDTKLAKEVTSLEDCAELQMSLESLRDWSAKWKLDFNISKCCSLQFSSRSKLIPSNYSYSMNDAPLPEKNHVKDLGVTICDDLTWSDHHNDICAKAYRQLGLLKRTFGRSSSVQALKVLYFTLVRSKLTYCSQLWRPQLVCEITALERVQRRATKFILQTTALDYRERLINLNILPLMMVYEQNWQTSCSFSRS